HDKGIQYVLVSIIFLCMWMYPGKLPFEINGNDIFLVFLIILLAFTVLVNNKFNFVDACFVLIATAYIGILFHAFIYMMIYILFFIKIIYSEKLPIYINGNDIFLVYLIILLAFTVLAKNKFNFDDAGFVLIATAYIGISFQALIDTRMAGLDYLLFILFIIWATDSGAYFVGKYFGKRKLWPEISPNKTIGGALGGILFALVTGSIFHLVSPLDYSFVSIVGITVLISVVGQIGDLVASAMK